MQTNHPPPPPIDLVTTAQAEYTELLAYFDNPLLAEDSTVAAEKTKSEAIYKTFSDGFAEMAKYKAMLATAAHTAAAKAAERAAVSKPPEALCDGTTAEEGAAAPATGLLAIPSSLRPDPGDRSREAPYSAKTVIQ